MNQKQKILFCSILERGKCMMTFYKENEIIDDNKAFLFSNDFNLSLDATILGFGYTKSSPHQSFGPALRNAYFIYFVTKGKGTVVKGGKKFELDAKEGFLITEKERVYYCADPNDPWEYWWIGWRGAKIEEFLRRTSLWNNPVFRYDPKSELFKQIQLLSTIKPIKNNDLRLNALMYSIFYQMTVSFPPHKEPSISPIHYVDQILVLIHQNYDRKITVHEIASALALDRSYLHRIFKEKMGVSIKDYLLQVRMDNACKLLRFTNLSIGDVGRSVGYDDELYFSRLFRKKMNQAPTAYRQQFKASDSYAKTKSSKFK